LLARLSRLRFTSSVISSTACRVFDNSDARLVQIDGFKVDINPKGVIAKVVSLEHSTYFDLSCRRDAIL
jgi:hypothetical protein